MSALKKCAAPDGAATESSSERWLISLICLLASLAVSTRLAIFIIGRNDSQATTAAATSLLWPPALTKVCQVSDRTHRGARAHLNCTAGHLK